MASIKNKFSINGLSSLTNVNLNSDYILVENSSVSKKTTLDNITKNTTFNELHTNQIYVQGVPLKGFTFKGLGLLSTDNIRMYDISEKRDISATSNAGFIYIVKNQNKKVYASNGTNWIDCGNIDFDLATYNDYGMVKIGKGLSVENGILSIDYNQIPTYQTFYGQNCDVAYTTPNGLVKQSILDSNIYVCETDEDLAKCMGSTISFKDIYNSWKRGGRSGVKWYGFTDYPVGDPSKTDDYGYIHWYYEEANDTIVQPNNTADDSFFYSPNTYSNYDLSVRCYSTHSDDDINGLILAFIEKDNSGKPRFLAALRSPNLENKNNPMLPTDQPQFHWYVTDSVTWASNGLAKIVQVNNPSGDLSGGWDSTGDGTVIRAKRTGSTIELWTTKFVSGATRASILATEPSYKITLDLNTICDGIFNQPAHIGYITASQPYSKYENLKIDLEKSVVDARKNTLSTYNPITRVWESKYTGQNTLSACGYGRIMKNDITNKSFYVTQNSFNRLVDYNEIVTVFGSTKSDIKLPSEKLVYENLESLSSQMTVLKNLIDVQLTRLNIIV